MDYFATGTAPAFTISSLAASLVAVWLIINEIISILENVGDIGVPLPGFLTKIVQGLKSKIEGAEE